MHAHYSFWASMKQNITGIEMLLLPTIMLSAKLSAISTFSLLRMNSEGQEAVFSWNVSWRKRGKPICLLYIRSASKCRLGEGTEPKSSMKNHRNSNSIFTYHKRTPRTEQKWDSLQFHLCDFRNGVNDLELKASRGIWPPMEPSEPAHATVACVILQHWCLFLKLLQWKRGLYLPSNSYLEPKRHRNWGNVFSKSCPFYELITNLVYICEIH